MAKKIDLELVFDDEGLASEEGPLDIVPAQEMSLAVVKPKFEHFVAKVDTIMAKALAIVVDNEDNNRTAVEIGGESKKIVKLIKAQETEVTAEAKEFVKGVDGICKILTDKLAAIEGNLKKKITDYQTRIELERRKQDELAKKAAADLQKKINAEAKKAGVEAPQVPAPVIPQRENVTRTESGVSSYQVKEWKCYVDYPDQVPREYCEPVGRLLNNAVKQGIREIPGCRIVEESYTRFRA